MPAEPDIKRAVSFIDGQNLYRHAKDAFGHHHPNYDPSKLADAVCADHGWVNAGVRFYTGIPSAHRAPMWHGYWNRRLTAMRRAGIAVTSRPLRYRVETVRLPDGSVHELLVEREKGVDLRLGLDVVRMARNAELDVAILFSQDQDLAEVAQEVRDISRRADRWLKVVCAFPYGPNATASRGHRPDRLVPDGSRVLRCLRRPEGLSAAPMMRTAGKLRLRCACMGWIRQREKLGDQH